MLTEDASNWVPAEALRILAFWNDPMSLVYPDSDVGLKMAEVALAEPALLTVS